MAGSKELGHDDSSGFAFAQEMLDGDVTAAINFDRVQKYRGADGREQYMILEYLLCEEDQMEKHHISPFRSHPNRYMHKNRAKFLALWAVARRMEAKLYLVNYAKAGTRYADEILLMQVEDVTYDRVDTVDFQMSRRAFQVWFRYWNARCLSEERRPERPKWLLARKGYYHRDQNCPFLREKRDFQCLLEEELPASGLQPCRKCSCTPL